MKGKPIVHLISPPFCGHLHPILAIGRILRDDCEVKVISTVAAENRVQNAGLSAVSVLPGADLRLEKIINTDTAIKGNPVRLYRQFRETLALLREMQHALEKYYAENTADLIIADFTLPIVGGIAEASGIRWWTSLPSPCVVECPDAPPAYFGGLLPARGMVSGLRNTVGHVAVRAFKRTAFHLQRKEIRRTGIKGVYREDGSEQAYSPNRILALGFGELEFGTKWPEAMTFIGPMLYSPPRNGKQPAFTKGKTHVLVSFGTHLQHSRTRIEAMLAKTAKELPHIEFHYSAGDYSGNDELRRNGNLTYFPYIDYERWVGCYDLVLHHGGAGIMNYCLKYGKPALVYPIDFDQFDNAARLEAAGVAKRVGDSSDIGQVILQALKDEGMRTRCSHFAKGYANADPAQKLRRLVAENISNAQYHSIC